jgi:hypothetical protein
MLRTKSIAKGIIAILAVMLFLGSMAIGVSPDQNVKAKFSGTVCTINASYGGSLFSGHIVSIALNPQPEPPIYEIGANVGKGIFSGVIVHPSINPQPEPPGASNIKN